MRKRGFFLFLLFLIAGCAVRQQSVAQELLPAQKQNPDVLVWDFGRVKAGEILKHDFVFKNDTAKPLNIKEVTTSCGCTVSEVKKKALRPGESTAIEIKFNTKGYSGPVTQYVYVHTDNLDNSIVKYTIKSDIVKK
jgi:hypothetical protein